MFPVNDELVRMNNDALGHSTVYPGGSHYPRSLQKKLLTWIIFVQKQIHKNFVKQLPKNFIVYEALTKVFKPQSLYGPYRARYAPSKGWTTKH